MPGAQRDLNEYLRKIGVRHTDPQLPTGGILQPVEVVLDSRYVTPPLLANRFYQGGRQAAQGAGNLGLFTLQAGGTGVRVVQVYSSEQGAMVIAMFPTRAAFAAVFAAVTVVSTLTPIPLGEPAAVSTSIFNNSFNTGNPYLLLGPWFGVLPLASGFTNTLQLDWWVPAGGVLALFQNSTANAPFDAFVEWTEPKGALAAP